ncbi:MAG: fibronectin type III domain-containing protein [Tidjanibacter sp.]|nr:fibronectin type III domain-containing protein [Tidjanibacter sp.]
MKKFFRIAALVASFAAVICSSCNPDPQEDVTKDPFADAKLEVRLVGTDKTTATVSLEGEVVKVLGYVVEPTETKGEYTAEEIFAMNNLVVLEKEGATQLTLTGLTPDTDYTVQFASRISSTSVWSQVKSLDFTTEMRDPVLSARVLPESIKATTASVEITTDNISRVAYLVKKAGELEKAPKIPTIFATGTVMQVVAGANTLELSKLSPNSQYVVYLAGEIAGRDEFFDSVVTVTGINTVDFTEQIRIYDIDYDNFKVDLKVDPEVKANNHVIRWAITDIVTWNNNYFGGLYNDAKGGDNCASSLVMNDKWYHNRTQESTTYHFTNEFAAVYDEHGNYIEADYYGPIAPGQPTVVMFGEYEWGDIEAVLGWSYGTPEQDLGYYIPLYSSAMFRSDYVRRSDKWEVLDESKYWTGFFHKEIITTKLPEVLDPESVKVSVETSPRDGIFTFEVTNPEVERVALCILEEDAYQTLINYFNTHDGNIDTNLMQWYTTCYLGMFVTSNISFNPWQDTNGNDLGGTIQMALSEWFQELRRGYNYRVFAVGLGGYNAKGEFDGHKQSFTSLEFQLPHPTKPAPEIIITPKEELATTDKVVFNIKCTTKDLIDAVYAVSTPEEFAMAGMSLADILNTNSKYKEYHLTSVLGLINSNAGFDLEIPAAPNEELACVVMGINDEGSKTISSLVSTFAKDLDAPERVEHEYFESLKGSWTATAKVLTSVSHIDEETGEETFELVVVDRSCEVVAGDIEYPETLSQEVYDIYAQYGHDATVVDGYYEEFKAAADKQNTKNRTFNRILMNGFNFEAETVPYFQYSSAFELFYSTTYNGATSSSMVKDFGPKWYLEIDAEGNVTVPFNVAYFDPMSSWFHDNYYIYESHLMGVYFDPENYDPSTIIVAGYFGDSEGGYKNGHFPVEVSEDGNTITINPLIYSYTDSTTGELVSFPLYPTSCINYGNGQFDPLEICSSIVLTRNTSTPEVEPEAAAVAKKAMSNHTKIERNIKTTGASKLRSRTSLKNIKPIPVLSVEQIRKDNAENPALPWHNVRRAQ